jgi:hypothetical protein
MSGMHSYLLTYASGETTELEADFYERDGEDWVFTAARSEVLRVPIEQLISISRA